MTDIELSMSCYPYDHVQALMDGRVKPQGINLHFVPTPSYETIRRMYKNKEFDVSESSTTAYITAKSQGAPFIAIPVFHLRKFVHTNLFINTDSGIKKPTDLVGKKVGVWVFQMTVAVWLRGVLQHEYGVPLDKIHWLAQKDDFVPYEGKFRVEKIPEGKSLDEMLVTGEIDALIIFSPSEVIRKSPKVRRLFSDFQKEEIEYFKKTGILPMMHTVIMKEGVYERYPWAAVSLLKAFQQSKELALRDMRAAADYRTNRGRVAEMKLPLVWQSKYIEEERDLFNGDPYPYNLRDNYKAIQTLVQYTYEQGLTRRLLSVEELFAENTREITWISPEV